LRRRAKEFRRITKLIKNKIREPSARELKFPNWEPRIKEEN
jgi:hypothetical protein